MALLGLAGDSWAAWRVVAKVIEGVKLDPAETELYVRCTGRASPPTAPPTEVWVIAGRRSGKSRFAGAMAVHAAGFTDYAGRLAPGERAVVALAASDREQARVLLGYAVDPFAATDALRALVRSRSLFDSLRDLVTRAHGWGIDLSTGVSVEVRTSHYGRVRGRTFALAVADEVSFWQDEEGRNPGSAVLNAIRPGLATLGGRLLVITTPYAKSGPTWDAFRRFHGVDDPTVLVWRAPSRVMNPTLPQAVVDAALARDEPAARSEFLAEFRDDVAALVTHEQVRRVVVPGRTSLDPRNAAKPAYVAFCDVSTGSGQDSMTLAIAHAGVVDGRRLVALDHLDEVRPPFDPLVTAQRFAEILARYGVRVVTGDRFAAGWVSSTFEREGIGYEPSALTRSELYAEFLTIVNAREVELLDVPRLVEQLTGLQRRPGGGGRDAIDHGQGRHDDLANVAAGAVVLAHRALRRPALQLYGAPAPAARPSPYDQPADVGPGFGGWRTWR
jgi:hypothetical protein